MRSAVLVSILNTWFKHMCMDGVDFQQLLLHGIPYKTNAPERFSFTFREHPKVKQCTREK